MDERVIQFRVGVVVLATILIATTLAVWFGKMPSFNRYTINIRFDEAPGVNPGTPIRKSGVKIGEVTKVQLNADRTVTVTAEIEPGRPLYRDEVCVIVPGLLLGDTNIEVIREEKPDLSPKVHRVQRLPPGVDEKEEPPKEPEKVQPGETMRGQSRSGPGRMVATLEGQLTDVAQSVKVASERFRVASEKLAVTTDKINDLLEKNRRGIDDAIAGANRSFESMEKAATNVSRMIGDEKTQEQFRQAIAKMPKTFDDIQEALGLIDSNLRNLEKFTGPFGEGGPERVARIDQAIGKLDGVMTQLDSFSRSINDPRGTLGRLIRDPELYTHLNSAMRNIDEVSQQLKPIINDARVFTDKIARHPETLGVRGAIQRNPGIK